MPLSALTPGASRPESIGPYRVLEVLGEGGMGVVYLAEQRAPVRRRVAVKLIKLGMDTRAVVARFEAERQALAVMDHPNIARVYDAGATADGRPYFVMEYVPGEPITDYCDRQRSSTAERLQLFIQLCQGVQHAHQKGIIHRDIKPTNVLVALQDGKPVPKIIDFGVAKATNQRLTEQTLYTERGQLVGTPEYMSPEQAEMAGVDIDTRTDIYSLGVLLYELLVGVLPFDSRTLRQAGYYEIQRIIREEEPPKPSTRLSGLGQESTEVAHKRRTELRALDRQLRRDLDWVTLKAMEKDRTRRYASASELAADLERYLGGEPVAAAGPKAGYRLRKFVRKNRDPVAAAIIVFLALTAGLVTSLVLYFKAREGVDLVKVHEAAATESERRAEENLKLAKAREEENAALAALAKANSLRALKAKETATESEDRATKAQTLVDEKDATLRRLEYAAKLRAAQDAWEHQDYSRMRRILGWTEPKSEAENLRSFEWYFLLSRACVERRLRSGEVQGLAFSPNGKALGVSTKAPSTTPSEVEIWDVQSATRRFSLRSPGIGVPSLAFSPDNRLLAEGRGQSVSIWAAATGTALRTVDGPPGRVVDCLAFSSSAETLAVGYRDRQEATWDVAVDLWDVASGERKRSLSLAVQVKTVHGFELSPQGEFAALSVDVDDSLRVWHVDSGETRLSITSPEHFFGLSFSANARRLAALGDESGAGTRSLNVWDLTSGRTRFTSSPRGDTGLALSPDGHVLACVNRVGTARLVELATGEETTVDRRFSGREVRGLGFSPDGGSLALCGPTGVELWTLPFEDERLAFASPTGVLRFCASRGVLALAASDDAIEIWDISAKRPLASLSGHEAPVVCLAFSPDGGTVASGSEDQSVRLWDSGTGKSRSRLRGHSATVNFVAFSGDGAKLASASLDGTVRLWEADGTRLLQSFDHGGPVRTAAFSLDGALLASGDAGGTVKLWSAATGEEHRSFQAHAGGVSCLSFSPDGSILASSGGDGAVKLWATTSERAERIVHQTKDPIRSLLFLPHGKRLAWATLQAAWVLDLETGGTRTLKHDRALVAMDIAPDSKTLALGRNGGVALWDPIEGEQDRTWTLPTPTGLAAVAPDGKTVGSAAADGSIGLWDVRTRRERHSLKGHAEPVIALAFSRQGDSMVSASPDGSFRAWDLTKGQERTDFAADAPFNAVWLAFATEGDRVLYGITSARGIASCGLWDLATNARRPIPTDLHSPIAISTSGDSLASPGGRSLQLWDARTFERRGGPVSEAVFVRSLVFSPGGEVLACGLRDGEVAWLDHPPNRFRFSTSRHGADVVSLAYSPDGRSLASGSLDSTVKLWDPVTGAERLTLTAHRKPIRLVSFAADGCTLLSQDEGGTLKLWEAFTAADPRVSADLKDSYCPRGRVLWRAGGSMSHASRIRELRITLPGRNEARLVSFTCPLTCTIAWSVTTRKSYGTRERSTPKPPPTGSYPRARWSCCGVRSSRSRSLERGTCGNRRASSGCGCATATTGTAAKSSTLTPRRQSACVTG
jgi:WD40 repeat protein/serine/threonine protein kinase